MNTVQFQKKILTYYSSHKRDFAWRRTTDPYAITVSEIMLQQTQVDRVEPKFVAFVKAFPTWRALDRAPMGRVLRAWQGLGYNRRAVMLKKLAHAVVHECGGKLPEDKEELEKLPGIGPYTSGAIRAFALNKPSVFLDTNIRRVYLYFFFPRAKNVSDDRVREKIAETMDRKNPRRFFNALMDYGAYLAAQGENPNRRSRHYVKQAPFEGSRRKVRGEIMRLMVKRGAMTLSALRKELPPSPHKTEAVVSDLVREGMLRRRGDRIAIAR
ncbi:MAG: A/G-specific adenine glycosylase [Patescibacteria group bacterium]|nr:A/G-specific adenine glycosylase [Patescibacteria group bacterium]